MMRVDDRAFLGEVTTPTALVNKMIDSLPDNVLESDSSTFYDPCFGNGTFIVELIKRLRKHGHTIENIQSRIYGCEISKRLYNKVWKKLSKYNFNNLYHGDALEYNFNNMKFDVVIGNPPYQDGNKAGGQNKLYNQFCKHALNMTTDNGFISFVTPTSVTKPSKRFTIYNLNGLKAVDFTAGNYFSQGVNICSWYVDKAYRGDVLVIQNTKNYFQSPTTMIQDTSDISETFVKIYQKLKSITDKPDLRMFKQNTIPGKPALSKDRSRVFTTPLYKIQKGKPVFTTNYTKAPVKLPAKVKVVFSMSKSLGDDSTIVSPLDFDQNHVFTDIDNIKQADNIRSFIFSDYFIEHSKQWKAVDGYGFNNALKFLPPFDKYTTWDNDRVKEFFESFILSKEH
jgi:hypothetical protein